MTVDRVSRTVFVNNFFAVFKKIPPPKHMPAGGQTFYLVHGRSFGKNFGFMFTLSAGSIGKHELDSVFLIDFGGTGVVVDGNYV